jgi:hypothetical protein
MRGDPRAGRMLRPCTPPTPPHVPRTRRVAVTPGRLAELEAMRAEVDRQQAAAGGDCGPLLPAGLHLVCVGLDPRLEEALRCERGVASVALLPAPADLPGVVDVLTYARRRGKGKDPGMLPGACVSTGPSGAAPWGGGTGAAGGQGGPGGALGGAAAEAAAGAPGEEGEDEDPATSRRRRWAGRPLGGEPAVHTLKLSSVLIQRSPQGF